MMNSRSVRLLTALLGVSAPVAAGAQGVSSRPASVQLVVIRHPDPPRAEDWIAPAGVHAQRLSPNEVELTTQAGLGGRAVRRLEVQLAAALAGSAVRGARVLVRDVSGQFVPLDAERAVLVADHASSGSRAPHAVVLRAAFPTADDADTASVPVTFRLIVGSGEGRAVWSYTVLLRAGRDTLPAR